MGAESLASLAVSELAQPVRPWMGPVGEVTWNLSLSLLEWVSLGRHRWYRQLRWGLAREFRDLRPNQMVLRIRGREPGSLAYGESPVLTILQVLGRLELPLGARVVDLGSGRGVPCFVAANQGLSAVGLEFFLPYVERCRRISARYGWPVQFLEGSFLKRTLPPAQLYWISSTAFPEDLRLELQEKLRQEAPSDAWVVTQDWVLEKPFHLELLQQLPVSWGVAKFCFHRLAP